MTYWMYAYDPDTGEIIHRKGDSGGVSDAIQGLVEQNPLIHQDSAPMIGCRMRVGSSYARTMSAQDWWMTTPVVEILKEWVDKEGRINVKFKTRSGSYYHWKGPTNVEDSERDT